MEHSIKITSKEKNSHGYYQGERIQIFLNPEGANIELLREIEAEIKRLKKLSVKNKDLYIKKYINVDFDTFAALKDLYKLNPLRPNSTWEMEFKIRAKKEEHGICSIYFVSPAVNFDLRTPNSKIY